MASADDNIVTKGLAKARIPFREQFKAWWDGDEAADGRAEPVLAARSSDGAADPAGEGGRSRWTPVRMELAQQVWGSGWTGPGGEQGLLDLVEPLDLQQRMKILVLGAGLGAANRYLAEHYGVTAKGLEADPGLVEAGMAKTIRANLVARAPVRAFSPASYKAKPEAYDGVIAKEFFFSLADRENLLRQAAAGLKSGCGIVMTDYVLSPSGQITPGIKSWVAREPLPAAPWTLLNYMDLLDKLGLSVQSTTDFTEATGRTITQAWANYMSRVDPRGLSGAKAAVMVKEAEIWTGRVKLLEAGDLQIRRIYAVKRP